MNVNISPLLAWAVSISRDLSAHRVRVVARSWEWVINDGTIRTYVIPTRQLHKRRNDQWTWARHIERGCHHVMTSTSIMLSGGVSQRPIRLLSTKPYIINHYNKHAPHGMYKLYLQVHVSLSACQGSWNNFDQAGQNIDKWSLVVMFILS